MTLEACGGLPAVGDAGSWSGSHPGNRNGTAVSGVGAGQGCISSMDAGMNATLPRGLESRPGMVQRSPS